MLLTCNECDWSCPKDEIGEAIMKEHLYGHRPRSPGARGSPNMPPKPHEWEAPDAAACAR